MLGSVALGDPSALVPSELGAMEESKQRTDVALWRLLWEKQTRRAGLEL